MKENFRKNTIDEKVRLDNNEKMQLKKNLIKKQNVEIECFQVVSLQFAEYLLD